MEDETKVEAPVEETVETAETSVEEVAPEVAESAEETVSTEDVSLDV